MTARLIDGNALAQQVRDDVAARVSALQAHGVTPGLAVVLVGDDPASQVYVRHKVADCERVGIRSILDRLAATLDQAALLARIEGLNRDPAVHGILVQLPLPAHIDAQRVIESISPAKDVDGFHVASAGALVIGRPGFKSCTPYGCMRMLESIGFDPKGKRAVVIGRSNIVGKPMALMLLAANATVTVCHSATPDLAAHTREADLVVAAVGRRNILTRDMVKPGAVIIDVGMNRIPDGQPGAGKLCGDVDFDGVREVASWITPVPGGVGPMTRAMLMVNTLEAALAAAGSSDRTT
jgi:methylenetetrahydrofolate dehydrogenase (NADP+)/methenyltetrahydrofolate cyclohydrolase